MSWPPHLADDVRFDHGAAADSAAALRQLATAIDGHAELRAQDLAAASHFSGGVRTVTDDLTERLGARAAELVRQLHAEAGRVESASATARHAAWRLDRARAAWLAEHRAQG